MMKILDIDDRDAGGILQKFPYPFSREYMTFEKHRGFSYFILCDGAEQTFIPLKVSKRQIFFVGIFTYAPVNIVKPLDPEEETRFLDEACDFACNKLNCIRIEPPSTTFVSRSRPTGSKAIELGLYTVDLTKGMEAVFAGFHANYRTQIRKAEKNGVEVHYGENEIEGFFECYSHTHKRQGLAYESLGFFRDFYKFLGPEKVLCATARVNGELESGVFVVFTEFAGYYLYAGSAEKTQFKGSTKKILWDCMNVMHQRGVKKFILGGARYKNVEGTKYEGIQLFKSLFGSEVADGYIWKKDLKPFMCSLYDFLFWLKCRLNGKPVPKDIIDSQLEE